MKAEEIYERYEGHDDGTDKLIHTIFGMASGEAYDRAQEENRGATHDEILMITQELMKKLENGVYDMIKRDFGGVE